MNCKNCNSQLDENEFYCQHCGAKIITERLTVKTMVNQLMTDVLGWDNAYFKTVKDLVLRPKNMLESYLEGTRKRYMNPLAFMIIGLTFSIFIFNTFKEQYVAISVKSSQAQLDWMAENLGGPYQDAEFQKEQLESSKKTQGFILQYFNLFTFIILPFYALLSKLTFGKPINYAEHLTINTYLQGLSFVSTPIIFMLSVWLNPNLFFIGILLTILLYCYVYQQLYGLSLGQTMLKVGLFLALLIGFIIGLMIIGVIIVVLFMFVTKSI